MHDLCFRTFYSMSPASSTMLASCVFWIMDVNGELAGDDDDDDSVDSKDWWMMTSFVAIFGGMLYKSTACLDIMIEMFTRNAFTCLLILAPSLTP